MSGKTEAMQDYMEGRITSEEYINRIKAEIDAGRSSVYDDCSFCAERAGFDWFSASYFVYHAACAFVLGVFVGIFVGGVL